MNDIRAVLHFIAFEGMLLAVLFFGVALAVTLLQQGIGRRLNDALGRTSLHTGAWMAATAGAVTPFCSCSTVPVLSGMLRSRVPFGVCFTFLIASPVINEGVLLVLLRQYSLPTAVIFLVVASLVSVVIGLIVHRIGMARYLREQPHTEVDGATQVASGSTSRVPLRVRLRFASRAAWSELRASAPYLAAGLVIGALIYGYVPQDAVADLQHRFPGFALILVLAFLGLPFYVNSTMVVPIALALLAKGMSIGPVAAFLVSSAGTSIPEVILLARLFRAPLIVSHVLSIIASAVLIGIALEWAARFI